MPLYICGLLREREREREREYIEHMEHRERSSSDLYINGGGVGERVCVWRRQIYCNARVGVARVLW